MIKYICDHCGNEIAERNVMQVISSARLEGKQYHLCKSCYEKYVNIERKFEEEMHNELFAFLTEGQNR